jgi:hypothetical protein
MSWKLMGEARRIGFAPVAEQICTSIEAALQKAPNYQAASTLRKYMMSL